MWICGVAGSTVEAGFSAVMPWLQGDPPLPMAFTRGDSVAVKGVELADRETSPPGYLTEAELIGLMEQHGIGTDASIPTHINSICERNFVNVP